jgi:hypothetical protein
MSKSKKLIKSSNTKLDKNVFESYKRVIDGKMKAGKDVTRLMDRLNHLIQINTK